MNKQSNPPNARPSKSPPAKRFQPSDSMKGQPADERNEREQIGDGVDAHGEDKTEHQPADEQTVGRKVRRERRCIR